MTWVITAPVDNAESDERVDATASLAVIAVDTLQAAKDLLADVAIANMLEHDGAPDAVATNEQAELRCSQLEQLRTALIDIFKIHKKLLDPATVAKLREGFKLANLDGKEHEGERKKITEEAVGHEVERLHELSDVEAKALLVKLTDLEPKF